jgi:hypothetical protein
MRKGSGSVGIATKEAGDVGLGYGGPDASAGPNPGCCATTEMRNARFSSRAAPDRLGIEEVRAYQQKSASSAASVWRIKWSRA